jgi:predicted ATPase
VQGLLPQASMQLHFILRGFMECCPDELKVKDVGEGYLFLSLLNTIFTCRFTLEHFSK